MPPTEQDPVAVTGRPHGVVCGVDGSDHAADAARTAGRAAARLGLGLQLVRAFDWPATGIPGLPEGTAGRAAARRSALGDLSRLADGLAAAHPATSVAGVLTDGTAPVVLHAAAGRASLLVVGARGHSWRDGPRTGSVAVAVARTSACPLLVHRPAPPGEGRRAGVVVGVVVGVDGGPGTGQLLVTAARAAGADGRLTVVQEELQGRTVGPAIEALRRTHPRLVLQLRRHAGPPGSLLVELSTSTTLVVVGHAAADGGLLSERAAVVLRRGHCSTLVVPLEAPARLP